MPSSSVSGPARIRAKPTLHPRQPIQGIPSETVVVNPRSRENKPSLKIQGCYRPDFLATD
jgi:hypothetical protein